MRWLWEGDIKGNYKVSKIKDVRVVKYNDNSILPLIISNQMYIDILLKNTN